MEHDIRILKQDVAEVRLSGGGKVLEGYAAVFGKRSEPLGGFVEEISPDATIEFDDVRASFNHSADQLLGRVKSGTLSVTIDDVGVAYRIKLPNTQAGNDVRELVKRKDVDGSSFMFDVLEGGDEWTRIDGGGTLRTLHKLKIYELGPVAYPAYPDTTAAVRSREAFEVRAHRPAGRRSSDVPLLSQRQREQEIAELCTGPSSDGNDLS